MAKRSVLSELQFGMRRPKISMAFGLLFAFLVVGLTSQAQVPGRAEPKQGTPTAVPIQADGVVQLPAENVPPSKFLSPEAKRYLDQHLHEMQDPTMTYAEKGIPRFMKPYLERDESLYPVEKKDTQMGGVHVFDYEPRGGVNPSQAARVLVNLHGGGFSGCWPGCADLESRPIASLGGIRVVSVDYRQGPDNVFPAASEDVASVYRALLKRYRASNIGIFGCSAGGMLTAESVAWFQHHALPSPGAIGIFCAGAGSFGGDAAYTSTPLGEGRFMAMPDDGGARLGYFRGTDPRDPLVAPLYSEQVMSKFPPTLVITGTRDFAMSGAIYTHSTLVRLGVDAELHVWEGLFHGFFYNPDVPESKEAYSVIIHFFRQHLKSK